MKKNNSNSHNYLKPADIYAILAGYTGYPPAPSLPDELINFLNISLALNEFMHRLFIQGWAKKRGRDVDPDPYYFGLPDPGAKNKPKSQKLT